MSETAGDLPGDDESGPVDPLLEALEEDVRTLRERLDRLHERLRDLEESDATPLRGEPAAWVAYTPPAAAGDPGHEREGPGFTMDNFVAWYNVTYAGLPGTRARPIPACWPHHPGLLSEIATLAHSWRDAFIGRTAHPNRAQLWHQHSRPGFAERLSTEWAHPHCHDGQHRTAGAGSRPDRYGLVARDREPKSR